MDIFLCSAFSVTHFLRHAQILFSFAFSWQIHASERHNKNNILHACLNIPRPTRVLRSECRLLIDGHCIVPEPLPSAADGRSRSRRLEGLAQESGGTHSNCLERCNFANCDSSFSPTMKRHFILISPQTEGKRSVITYYVHTCYRGGLSSLLSVSHNIEGK